MAGTVARSGEPDLAGWTADCRLNPAQAAAHRFDDPQVAAAYASMAANFGAAMRNLAGQSRASVPIQARRDDAVPEPSRRGR